MYRKPLGECCLQGRFDMSSLAEIAAVYVAIAASTKPLTCDDGLSLRFSTMAQSLLAKAHKRVYMVLARWSAYRIDLSAGFTIQ